MIRFRWRGVTLLVVLGLSTTVWAEEQSGKSNALNQEPGAVIGGTGRSTAPVEPSAPAEPATATSSAEVAVTAPAATPTTASPAVGDAAARAANGKAVMEKLNGTEWAIELSPMYGGKAKPALKDSLRFDNGQITSASLSKEGYAGTNCTVTVGEDGVPVWETMQTSEGKGVVFWRGELYGDTMRGILSKHPIEGNTEDYSFTGKQSGAAAAPSAAEPAPAQPAAAQVSRPAPAEPERDASADTGKKRKKGWF